MTKRWPYTAECPTCGTLWLPTAYESETFPGSGCDLGECLCVACEAGDPCWRHDPPDTPDRRRRDDSGEHAWGSEGGWGGFHDD